MTFLEQFPEPNELIKLTPEALGLLLLAYLAEHENNNGNVFRSMATNENSEINDYLVHHFGGITTETWKPVVRALNEAWGWLESEVLLVQSNEETTGTAHCFITKGGKEVLEKGSRTYLVSKYLDRRRMDTTLMEKISPSFFYGDFDTAIFAAFKEVEVRIRNKCGYPNSLTGKLLAKTAFDPDNGPLTDLGIDSRSERKSIAELFSGALGTFRNPVGHRDVDILDPSIASDMVSFANLLLNIVEAREVIHKDTWETEIITKTPDFFSISLEGKLLKKISFRVKHLEGKSWRAGIMIGAPTSRPKNIVDPNAVTCHVGEPPYEKHNQVWLFDPEHDRSHPIENEVQAGSDGELAFEIVVNTKNFLKISINKQTVYSQRIDPQIREKAYLLAWSDEGNCKLRFTNLAFETVS